MNSRFDNSREAESALSDSRISHSREDEVGDRRAPLLSWLQRSLRMGAVGAVLFGIAGVIVLGIQVAIRPAQDTFLYAVHFTFGDAHPDGTPVGTTTFGDAYPNGTPFGITDLISQDVLKRVHEELSLDEHAIAFGRFAGSIAVQPYSPVYDEMVGSYRAALSDRRLAAAERERIENDMVQTLQTLVQRSAIIRLSVPSNLGISPGLGETILARIPETWSRIAIKDRGVLNLPRPPSLTPIVSDGVPALHPVVATEVMEQAASDLENLVDYLARQPISYSIRNPATAKTIGDVERALAEFRLSSLAMLTAAAHDYSAAGKDETAVTYLRKVISDLEGRVAVARKRAQSYSQSVAQLGSSPPSSDAGTVGVAGAEGPAESSASRAVPQLGSDFLNSMIGIVQRSGREEFQFRTEMIRAQISSARDLAILEREQERAVSRLADLMARQSGQLLSVNINLVSLRAEMTKAAQSLNALWSEANMIASRAGPDQINYSNSLYIPLPVESGYERYHPVLNTSGLIFLLALLVVGFLVFGSGAFAWLAFSHYRKSET